MRSKNTLMNTINSSVENMKNKANQNFVGPYEGNSVKELLQNINELSFEIRDKNEALYDRLQWIRDHLFYGANFVNAFALGALDSVLQHAFTYEDSALWQYMHPRLIELCKKKFEDGHYADAVQTALIEICSLVRDFRESVGGNEIPSDKDMLHNTFSNLKLLSFTDSSTASLKNIQEGYEKIFPGITQAWRNPNAHRNVDVSEAEAARKLMMASDLMYMLDTAFERVRGEQERS